MSTTYETAKPVSVTLEQLQNGEGIKHLICYVEFLLMGY